MWGSARGALIALTTGLVTVMLITPSARAGTWIQVSCVNPNGSTAPNQGWSSYFRSEGANLADSDASTACTASTPMYALLSTAANLSSGPGVGLQYTPPAGSALAGGTVDVNLLTDGWGDGNGGEAAAALTGPNLGWDTTNVITQCIYLAFGPCQNGTDDFYGTVTIPSDHAGGDLFLDAGCGGDGSCDSHPSGATYWAQTQLVWARLLLTNGSTPQASNFSGSALQPGARGTAHLVFTAIDPDGPGIYSVTTTIDGRTVWSGTPDTNDGLCVPVGTDPSTGALMFDGQQPCPATAVVDAPVPTAGVPDGTHELAVTIVDAAQNTSTVFDQTITTSNPQTTPDPSGRRAIHAVFVISWHWNPGVTLLRSITVKRLPRDATVTIACTGRRCPSLEPRRESARHDRRLLGELRGRRLAAGDRLEITVTAPRRRAEHIELDIRDNRMPLARLLKR
jgi:hypothetical protein